MYKDRPSDVVPKTLSQPALGTITRVSSNSLVYVTLDDSSERSVSFTPRVVQGYGGQELTSFGFVPGNKVKIEWDTESGAIGRVKLVDIKPSARKLFDW